MSLSVAVPAAVDAQLRALTNNTPIGPITSTIGGHSNLTFRTTVDGDEVVVKAATDDRKREDLRREARVLAGLAELDQPLRPVPPLLAHGDGDGVTVTVLGALPGELGVHELDRRTAASLRGRAASLGRTLRAVHGAAVRPDPEPTSFLAQRFASLEAVVGALDLAPSTRAAMIDSLNAPVHRRGVAFVHGDAGFHNTLWTRSNTGGGRLSALLDWEFAGWGNPLTDVAWFSWTVRFRGLDESVWSSFADAYGAPLLDRLGLTPTTAEQLIRAQIVSLLIRTPAGSAARSIWIDRWHQLPLLLAVGR